MSLDIILILAFVLIVALAIAGAIFKRRPRSLKLDYFTTRWQEMQQLCKDQDTWPHALQMADKLLDEALKKRRFRGKSMGERMVAAQRAFNNNDSVWYAHNLCKKTVDDANLKLKEADIKQALLGIRQALKDLGAFEDDRSRNS